MGDRLYRVTSWNTIYENNRSRDLKKTDWVPIPNRLDGDGYTELVDHPNGAAHYGAWLAIVLIASRCNPRGVLLREGSKPHTPHSLARMSRLPAEIFEESIPRFIDIGWLEVDESGILSIPTTCEATIQKSQAGAARPHAFAVIPHQGVQKERKKEGNERTERTLSGGRENISIRLNEFLDSYPKRTGRDAASRAYISLIESESDHRELMAGLQRWLVSDQWVRSLKADGGRYIPDADKFLFERKWLDEPTPHNEQETEDKFERAARLALDEAA